MNFLDEFGCSEGYLALQSQKSEFPFKKIVFWEPCLSPHKSDLFEALCAIRPELKVVCCADSDISEERKNLGWSFQKKASFEILISPSDSAVVELVGASPESTLHIFSGIRWFPTIVKGFVAIKSHRGFFAIMSEPRVLEGWRGKLRLLQSWFTESHHRINCRFILAIGRNGRAWFKVARYNDIKIFSFAYFVSPPRVCDFIPSSMGLVRIGYLGRFVRMKGVFDLVDAACLLPGVSLEFAGGGIDEHKLRAYCDSRKINYSFAGVLPIAEIGHFFSRVDVLVLASTSTDDGWGVVVSEALMSGVAVVASTAVGASLVLDRPLFGRCVPPSSPSCIADAISDLKKSDAFTPAQRTLRSSKAISMLSASAGAENLLNIIKWSAGQISHPQEFHHGQGV